MKMLPAVKRSSSHCHPKMLQGPRSGCHCSKQGSSLKKCIKVILLLGTVGSTGKTGGLGEKSMHPILAGGLGPEESESAPR